MGDWYFKTTSNLPWGSNIPVDWHHPLEWLPIQDPYPDFVLWAESSGMEAQDGYLPEYRVEEYLFLRELP